MLPRALITTGTVFVHRSSHNLFISLFRTWYFSTFSNIFSAILLAAGTAISAITASFRYSNINYYSLFLFLMNYYNIWSSCLNDVIIIYIDTPQTFHGLLLKPMFPTQTPMYFLCHVIVTAFVLVLG